MSGEKTRLYRCPVCDTVVEVLDKIGIDLVCCGPAMVPLKPKTTQAGAERHLPVIEKDGRILTVTVGGKRHPMEEDHHIEWIEVAFAGKCFRQFLQPGQEPRAAFEIGTYEKEVAVQAYCNVHGLWESSEKVPSADADSRSARGYVPVGHGDDSSQSPQICCAGSAASDWIAIA